MARFQKDAGDWTRFRQWGSYREVDFHPPDRRGGFRFEESVPYWERMQDVEQDTLTALKAAQRDGIEYVIFTHGSSTSRIGKTTARSQVRKVMRPLQDLVWVDSSGCNRRPPRWK